MSQYNEKIWTLPFQEIVPAWTSNRIVIPDLKAIIAGVLRRVPFQDFPNAAVSYPASGGFINFYRGFLPHVEKRLRLRTSVERIDLWRRCVVTGSGDQMEYTNLISTMPLNELIHTTVDPPEGCRAAVDQLNPNIAVKKASFCP